ncbi:MAG: NAD-dependent epimerase/dehydratase family protein [Gammaproteobacteria bacterium]|nr:NAD-dependent epimerase/dehydratase family protein [Gammaproteobacteria bacterium]
MVTTQRNSKVLVTGATGFIAGWCIIQLLEAGYQVRGTVRSLSSEPGLKRSLGVHTSRADDLELVESDLKRDEGWDEAMDGCESVLHLASPFPLEIPENEEDLIVPAVEGTRRVLSAAARNEVRRVVQTSSVAAIASAAPDQNRTFTERDWSYLEGDIEPYPKSKTLAEKAAWEFMEALPPDHPMELVVINPGYVLGPVLNSQEITSIALHKRLMSGGIPGVTKMKLNIVDVRDVAQAHLAAMTVPEAAGKRFICVAGGMFLPEIANILSNHFKSRGYPIPTLVLPSWIVRLYGLIDRVVRENTKGLGNDPKFDNSRIKEILNWKPYPLEKTIIEMGESMIDHGIV